MKHFKDVCAGASFSVQNIYIFSDTGYKINKVCPANCESRLGREDY